MPDYAYVREELLRNGVSKKLLWTEYMEDCRANNEEPLMYSQFCFHIQQDEQKHRATRQPTMRNKIFLIESNAISYCPVCGEPLVYKDSCEWDMLLEGHERHIYLIRRLKCK